MSTAREVATHVPPAEPARPARQDPPPVGAATTLLDGYSPRARFLATPTRTLFALPAHREMEIGHFCR